MRRHARAIGAIAVASWLPFADAHAHSLRPAAGGSRDGPVCAVRPSVAERASSWAAPLDRIVTVRVPDATVREALDRVAGLAQVELSYSSDLLPREKRVCLTLDRVPVGAVLETLLEGTTLRAIVVGTSQVVLAPSREASESAAPVTMRRASVLDRVVVTGTPDGASQRGSPFALDVIDGATLSRTRSGSLGEALELAVPGVWTWSGSAGTLSARFGSIRGASSFGVTTPKIYLDGVEVANPLIVTGLDASRIDRVEVIRGPQGAALYGADAISGVVNILTRHDGTPSGSTTLQLSTSGGMAATDYAARNAFVQDHALSLRGGSGRRTFGMGVNFSSVGAYVPGASERYILADGDVRVVRSRSVLTATARLSLQRANASNGLVFGGAPGLPTGTRVSPQPLDRTNNVASLMGGVPGPEGPPPAVDTVRFGGDSATGQDISQYTLGATATVMPSLRWTGTLIGGVDGYRLRGLSAAGLPFPTSGSSDPTLGQGAADRGALRARAVGRFDLAPNTTLSVTLGAEQTITRDIAEPLREIIGMRSASGAMKSNGENGPRPQPGGATTTGGFVTTWTNNTGVLAQGNLAWRDALFLAVGGRVERNTGATPNAQVAYLPMLGATYVRDVRGMVLKFRGAYGTGIRPAHSLARAATWMGRTSYARSTALQPESQTGTEAGIDLLFGKAVLLHLTRFDQRASGLIQPVTTTTTLIVNGRAVRFVGYELENVGAIDNRGWEMQGSTTFSRLRLGGAYTIVSSRVARVAQDYGGELRAGDRMLDVPARTASVTATWFATRWDASATVTRAEDWVSYDRIAIGSALQQVGPGGELGGPRLRDFWSQYDDITRLRASVAYRFSRALSGEIGGENLLNVQRGAPDNATVTAGRTIRFGLRTQF